MAIILQPSRILVLHIPKTGGIWVVEALEKAGVQFSVARVVSVSHNRHATSELILDKFSPRMVIAFIVHPLTWYESWWKYNHTPDGREAVDRSDYFNIQKVWHPMQAVRPFANLPFQDWVDQVLEKCPGYVTWMYRVYLGTETRKLVMTIGKREHLARDLVSILDRFKVKYNKNKLVNTPPKNISKKLPTVWTKKLVQRAMDSEVAIIDRYYNGNPPDNLVIQ